MIKKTNYNLPSRVQTLFLDVNEKIASNIIEEDDRLKLIKELEYEGETYERIRYELSLSNNKIKEKIKEIINSKKNLDEKRAELYKYLQPIIKNMIYLNPKPPNLKNYKIPNERTTCNISIGKDPHCIKVGKKYKINVPKVNLVRREDNFKYILAKLSEELCRNTMKRHEILNGSVPNIIDRGRIKALPDEIILEGSVSTIEEDINALYKEESKYDLIKYGSYDYEQPPILNRYPNLLDINDDKAKLEDLSSFWVNKTTVKLKIHYKNYAKSKLYEALAKVANILKKSSEYSSEDIKKMVLENINTYTKEIKRYFNVKSVIEAYRNSNLRFKSVYDMDEIKAIFKDKEYQGTIVDIFIFHKLFKIGVLVLDKRVMPSNPDGYEIMGSFENYFILYRENISNIRYFNLVQENDRVLFDNKNN